MHQMDTVVVFGDSLSDIGLKWKTLVGSFAYYTGKLTCSPTGRFSDCRNWTDYMFEEAGASSLIKGTAGLSKEASYKHHSLKSAPSVLAGGKRFTYVNYAKGGACGLAHSPLHQSKEEVMGGAVAAIALSTFADQVDQFTKDLKALPKDRKIGNTLFLVWFGANDLYTACCDPNLMTSVAAEVANKQRVILHNLVQSYGGSSWFIFIDIAYPLSSVRYSLKLKSAKDLLKQAVLNNKSAEAIAIRTKYERVGRKTFGTWADVAKTLNLETKALEIYEKQLKEITDLEKGVFAYNSRLAEEAGRHGDRVVNMGAVLDPQTLKRLVAQTPRLTRNAMTSAAVHLPSNKYDQLTDIQFLATNDEAHPTDPIYRLIWQEIQREIFKANVTFGSLPGLGSPATLSSLNRITLDQAEQRDTDEYKPLLRSL